MKKFFIPVFLTACAVVVMVLFEDIFASTSATPALIARILSILGVVVAFLVPAGLAFICNILVRTRIMGIIASVVALVLGISCVFAYSIIGVEVGEDGMLREAFGFLFIGFYLMLTGLMLLGNIFKRQGISTSLGVLGIVIAGFSTIAETLGIKYISIGPYLSFGIGLTLIFTAVYWSMVCVYNNRSAKPTHIYEAQPKL